MESDEAVVRAKLLAMQERIVRDPFDALGLASSATPDGVRSAFLELTKVYHPARFGRMSSDIQRLANEVFLALRSAHDAVARTVRARATTAPTGATSSSNAGDSQAMAALAAGTARTPFGQGVRPATSPGAKRPSDQIPPVGPPERPTPMPTAARPRTSEMPVLQKPAIATTGRLPVQSARPTGAMPPVAKATPAEGTRVIPATPPPAGPERDVASAIELLERGQWDAGRAILQALADKFPTTPRYRALVSYALGRQAQVEQRLNEARVELDRALQIDPTLQLAKTALGELFSRRK